MESIPRFAGWLCSVRRAALGLLCHSSHSPGKNRCYCAGSWYKCLGQRGSWQARALWGDTVRRWRSMRLASFDPASAPLPPLVFPCLLLQLTLIGGKSACTLWNWYKMHKMSPVKSQAFAQTLTHQIRLTLVQGYLENRRDLIQAAELWTFIFVGVLCHPTAAPVLMCAASCRTNTAAADPERGKPMGPLMKTQVGHEEHDNMQKANRPPFLLKQSKLSEGWEE